MNLSLYKLSVERVAITKARKKNQNSIYFIVITGIAVSVYCRQYKKEQQKQTMENSVLCELNFVELNKAIIRIKEHGVHNIHKLTDAAVK